MRFVLIHGGFHGAWCWDRTIPELERLGHEAIAIDLPGHGRRVDEESRHDLRREAIVSVLEPGDVLVGHSGGGYDITLGAAGASQLVSHLVYLAAGLPLEGHSILEATGGKAEESEDGELEVKQLMTDETGMLQFIRPNADGRLECIDFQGAWDFFYHDCDEATARWAYEQLSPGPHASYSLEPVSVPRYWEANLPRSYILCLRDRAKPHAMSVEVARRLGVEPIPIDTSHSPFLSRPAELAELLVYATTTEPTGPLIPD
ncbi:MAG: alpha/beta fold hydrolase [Acidimicrobiia bacterium]